MTNPPNLKMVRYQNFVAARVGEQHLVLDNQRFIGDVDWRQNWQTFDLAGIGGQPVTNLHLYYGYVWDVHRPYGNVGGLAAANRDFDSKSHLINISYSDWEYAFFDGQDAAAPAVMAKVNMQKFWAQVEFNF